MLYTTYFAKLGKLPPLIKPVAICLYPPDWYTSLCYKQLAPKNDFFRRYKETGDEITFTNCFRDQVLRQLDPLFVEQEIYGLAHSNLVALVCYEKPELFCHRHLVSQWFNSYGIDCHELNF